MKVHLDGSDAIMDNVWRRAMGNMVKDDIKSGAGHTVMYSELRLGATQGSPATTGIFRQIKTEDKD